MADFRMPSLGADMEAGTLVEWTVKPGDRVARGDVVAVVETQKGAIEIEIFDEGVVDEILVGLGTKVPVGTPLARIRGAGEPAPIAPSPAVAPITAPPAAATPPQPAAPPARPAPAAAPGATPAAAPVPGRVRASPAARRLAASRGIDLATLAGSGPDGAVIRADVARTGARAPAAPAPKRAGGLDLDAMRVAIASAMARSKREIPHYYLTHEIDLSAAEGWLSRTNAERPPERRLLMGALTLKAVALACKRYPAFNGFHVDGRFAPATAVHPGVAIAIRGGGLVAPAIHDADTLPLDELMKQLRDLIGRVRAGTIRSSEMTDPTITVSSLGDRGVDALWGVIYPPQVAIVGFGKAARRPWVVDDAIAIRSVMVTTLAADHRVSDGHAGALFLAEIGKFLQEPDTL